MNLCLAFCAMKRRGATMEQMKTDTNTGRCFSSLSPTSYHNGNLFNVINHKKANYLAIQFYYFPWEKKSVKKSFYSVSNEAFFLFVKCLVVVGQVSGNVLCTCQFNVSMYLVGLFFNNIVASWEIKTCYCEGIQNKLYSTRGVTAQVNRCGLAFFFSGSLTRMDEFLFCAFSAYFLLWHISDAWFSL